MKHMTRRSFLRHISQGALSLGALSAFGPSIALAQKVVGNGRNIILINHGGGMDGLGFFPYYQGSKGDYLRSSLRPDISLDPATVIPFAPSAGSDRRGFHPKMRHLTDVASSNIAMLQQVGTPTFMTAAHDGAQFLYSFGNLATPGSLAFSKGWLTRLMENADLDLFQVTSVGPPNMFGVDFVSLSKRPFTVKSIAAYDNASRFGFPLINLCPDGKTGRYCGVGQAALSQNEDALLYETEKHLGSAQEMRTVLDTKMRAAEESFHDGLDYVAKLGSITLQGTYTWQDGKTITPFQQSCIDCMKILTHLASDPAHQSESRILYINDPIYDFHANFNSRCTTAADSIGGGLGGLVEDLKASGLWQNTVIVTFSEFGRKFYQNAKAGEPAAGTDHGYANTHLVIGGAVRAALYGDDISMTEMQKADGIGAPSVSIDFRRPFVEALNWAGFPTEGLFEGFVDYAPLGLFV